MLLLECKSDPERMFLKYWNQTSSININMYLNYQQRGGQVQSSGKGTVDQIVHGETIDQNLDAKKLQLKALRYATLAKRMVNWLMEGRDW